MAEGILNPIPQLEADFDFDVYTKQEVDTLLDGKADKVDTYTKTETDALLNEKADVATTYTKTETNDLLNEKADKSTTLAGYGITDAYTKTQTDNLLAGKADTNSVYTKEETDNLLSVKANSADVYTKTEANNLLSAKADSVNVYTKTEADTLLAGKANVDDVYTKTEIDNQLTVTKDGTWVKGTQTTATNFEKLEGGIEYLYGLLSYKYSQLRKYINGNYYDYETNTDSAYTKTVPSCAMPYAGLEKLGGKTLVWNQLCNMSIGNFSASAGATKDTSGDVPKFVANATGTNFGCDGVGVFNATAGHKYIVMVKNVQYSLANGLSKFFTVFSVSGHTNFAQRDAYLIGTTLYTLAALDYGGSMVVRFRALSTSVQVGDYISGEEIGAVDLTELYGAGNEPTTVAEFKSMFPASYYPYNAGTLLSAGVTEVVSKGRNLFYSNDSSYTNTTNGISRVWDKDTQTITLNGTNTKTDSAWLIVQLNPAIVFKVGETYTISSDGSTTLQTGLYFNLTYYDVNGTTKGFSLSKGTFTVPAYYVSFRQLQIGVLKTATTINTTIKVQIEKGSTATSYSPYHAPIPYPIPASIQALEGYGWSAGTAYNYIDYERKVFVKNVGRVDLGTLSWTSMATDIGGKLRYVSSDLVGTIKNGAANVPADFIVCNKYFASGDTYHRSEGLQVGSDGKIYIYDSTKDNLSGADFTTAMSGTDLNYELATPQETDISAYLTDDDNLIEVEAGGTLTFENQHGDDYRIPVPSTQEYMINLQEAVSNG